MKDGVCFFFSLFVKLVLEVDSFRFNFIGLWRMIFFYSCFCNIIDTL